MAMMTAVANHATEPAMKRLSIGATFLLIAQALLATLTYGAEQSRPAPNPPAAQPPVIHPDHKITFRFRAPEARSVAVAGGDGRDLIGEDQERAEPAAAAVDDAAFVEEDREVA